MEFDDSEAAQIVYSSLIDLLMQLKETKD